ncbi:MAG: hypothetical protein ACRDPC_17085 [Solirubrobacteraceae bacterium]
MLAVLAWGAIAAFRGRSRKRGAPAVLDDRFARIGGCVSQRYDER